MKFATVSKSLVMGLALLLASSAFAASKEFVTTQPNTYAALLKAIIDATHDLVCAFKPQFAHYAAYEAERSGAPAQLPALPIQYLDYAVWQRSWLHGEALEREIDFWNRMSSEYKKFEKGIPTGDFGEDSLWGHPPKRFYRNLDGRHFAELAAVTGLESDANQRGLVVLDANSDGVPDLFATGFLSKPQLWVNRNPSAARSLAITLQGLPAAKTRYRSTREALGALVTVEAGGLQRTQVVSAGYSFLSSGSKTLFFGLGDRPIADRVTIRWPSGKISALKDVPAGKLSLCEPPDGTGLPAAR